MRTLSVIVAVAALASGCAHAQAKTMPDGPLEMPTAPPHDVEPRDAEPSTPVPLVQEPARNTPSRPRPPAPARPEPARPESPVAEQPRPVEEPPKPATTLQTTPSTAEGDVERAIRATLAKAASDLNRIDYRALNADARTQYNTAKRFLTQAEDAMRAKNLVFARTVADKAAALAGQLAGR